MSFFKSFLTQKSNEHPFDSCVSAVSRGTVETNPRIRSSSSCNVDEQMSSSRKNNNKEPNKYLNLVNQELNHENVILK